MSSYIFNVKRYFSTMPRTAAVRKSLKHVCLDTILFFALFALIGHLTINFWERYTIQSELTSMKTSLHTLKDTVTNIGKAYDNLHCELKDINFKVVDTTSSNKKPQKASAPCMTQGELESFNTKCKNKCHLDRKHAHDLQVQALILKPCVKKEVGMATDKVKKKVSYRNKTTEPYSKDAATITRNPPVSTGVATSRTTRYDTDKSRYETDKSRYEPDKSRYEPDKSRYESDKNRYETDHDCRYETEKFHLHDDSRRPVEYYRRPRHY